jgi:hypothetical protein
LILQPYTFLDLTPILTIDLYIDEHDGRYSDGTHSMLVPLCRIHVVSELRLVLTYKGRLSSAIFLMLETIEFWIIMVPMSVRRKEVVESKDDMYRLLPTLTV